MKPSNLTIAFFFAGVLLISYLVLIIIGDNGLRDLNAMKQQLRDLKAENEILQQKNVEMHRKIKRLKEDPEFIENIARQELKMIAKDEVVFKFKEDGAAKNRIPDAANNPSGSAPADPPAENRLPKKDG